jgi:RNA polymerase sigma-70 factor, ECF subfamily
MALTRTERGRRPQMVTLAHVTNAVSDVMLRMSLTTYPRLRCAHSYTWTTSRKRASPMQPDTLIARAKQRDPAALSEIYTEHAPAVYRYIRRRINEHETAEDLCSDVFVKMLEKIEQYEERGWPITAWLYRIAHDRTIDMYRKQKRQTVPLDAWEGVTDDLEEQVVRKMEADDLWRMLAFLTNEQRSVLELRFLADLDVQRVAAHLGRTEGSVKALQHRGVVALRSLVVL